MGPALGLMPGTRYEQVVSQLHPGDTLLLYTDGAFEVFNSANVELLENGLGKIVGAQDLSGGIGALAAVEESLLVYSNNLALPDDLTLLSIHRPAAKA